MKAASQPITPDGRYVVVRGRLWRAANPGLAPEERQRLVDRLMDARRLVRSALKNGDDSALRPARAAVEQAKRGLGKRGPVSGTSLLCPTSVGNSRPNSRTRTPITRRTNSMRTLSTSTSCST